jgi:hypothetical protein
LITLAFGVTAVKVSSYQTLSRKGRDALVYPRLRSAAHVGLIRGDVLERFETERHLPRCVVIPSSPHTGGTARLVAWCWCLWRGVVHVVTIAPISITLGIKGLDGRP